MNRCLNYFEFRVGTGRQFDQTLSRTSRFIVPFLVTYRGSSGTCSPATFVIMATPTPPPRAFNHHRNTTTQNRCPHPHHLASAPFAGHHTTPEMPPNAPSPEPGTIPPKTTRKRAASNHDPDSSDSTTRKP